MHVSYTGPREDVSLKALGGYAPSALQTDILPRSRYRRHIQSARAGIESLRIGDRSQYLIPRPSKQNVYVSYSGPREDVSL